MTGSRGVFQVLSGKGAMVSYAMHLDEVELHDVFDNDGIAVPCEVVLTLCSITLATTSYVMNG
jgi:hypothetical protein